MNREEINFWNERFSGDEYIYGDQPNEYLKEKLKEIQKGKILFPAEGEGRNSVYAAMLGFDSFAFDQSDSGKQKALQLASTKGVEITYDIFTMDEYQSESEKYDAVALIYAHFHKTVRRAHHQKLIKSLQPGGYLILEAFSKDHIKFQKENPTAGGPGNIDMLYNLDEIKDDFKGFEFLEATEKEITLKEGNHHKGNAVVVRIFARKI